MKNFLNLCSLFFVLVFFSSTITAQKYSGLLLEKQSVFTGQNLRSSVKTVYAKVYSTKKTLSDTQLSDFIMNNDTHEHNYIYFDKYGNIKESFGVSLVDHYVIDTDKNKIRTYEYDENDLAEKSKYQISLKQYYPISNHNLLVKLNRLKVQKREQFVEDTLWQEYDKDEYIYLFDEEGKIIEEQEYNVFRFAKVIEDKTPKKEDLFSRKIFSYNNKGQVVNQKIIAGSLGSEMPYTDLGTESQFCDDLQLQYTYDVKGRITQTTMYGCGKIVDREDYIYHPTKDYVEKVKYYVTGPGEISNPTKSFIKMFNERGDIIKKEFILNDPNQKLDVKINYYTYEYDSRNNWIKCYMFLEGTQEGEPTLVAERKIEYYN